MVYYCSWVGVFEYVTDRSMSRCQLFYILSLLCKLWTWDTDTVDSATTITIQVCYIVPDALHSNTWVHKVYSVYRLPLTQCKQKFSSMDTTLRNTVKSLLSDHCEKFNMDQNSLFIPTFVASMGYRSKISAVDYTLACATILEDTVSGMASCFIRICIRLGYWGQVSAL